jgi:hypothetical protein
LQEIGEREDGRGNWWQKREFVAGLRFPMRAWGQTFKGGEAMVVAKLRFVNAYGCEEIIVPANPAYWHVDATSVQLVGVEEPPQALVEEAEAWGWRYSPLMKRFYPMGEGGA